MNYDYYLNLNSVLAYHNNDCRTYFSKTSIQRDNYIMEHSKNKKLENYRKLWNNMKCHICRRNTYYIMINHNRYDVNNDKIIAGKIRFSINKLFSISNKL